jgi:amphi-Trp domain-containing protein
MRRRSAVTDFIYRVSDRVTRQQAAEQLMDIAYALAAGAPLEFRLDGRRVSIPLAEEMLLERESHSNAHRVELELQLSWTSPYADEPAVSAVERTAPAGPAGERE